MIQITGALHVTPFPMKAWGADQELYNAIRANEVLSNSQHDWLSVLEPDDELHLMVMNEDFELEGTYLLEELRQFALCIQEVLEYHSTPILYVANSDEVYLGYGVSVVRVELHCGEPKRR